MIERKLSQPKNKNMASEQTYETVEYILTELRGFTKESRNLYVRGEDRMIVSYAVNEIKKGDVHPLIQQLDKNGATAAFLIVAHKITPGATKVLKSLTSFPIEVFYEWQLISNVLKHEMSPRYEIVPPESHAEVFRTFASPDKLPRIRSQDIAVRYLGASRNSILKITSMQSTGIVVEYKFVH
jgi:DNA-directed RNA polymerase subunit H (RpoH/RPB5)